MISMIHKPFSVIVLSSIVLSSCCKEGTGGDAALVIYLKHHAPVIPNHISYPDTVYVKFNAKDSPGSLGNYDAFFVGVGREDHVLVSGLKCGDYYLFGTAIDSSGPYRVTGGMHIKIRRKDRKKEIVTDLVVTE